MLSDLIDQISFQKFDINGSVQTGLLIFILWFIYILKLNIKPK